MSPENQAITRADLDRAVESIAIAFSELRQEFKQILLPVSTRVETTERRTERIETNVNSILMQLAGMSRSLTVGEQLTTQFAITQAVQQNAIDQLAARLSKLERELHPGQPGNTT